VGETSELIQRVLSSKPDLSTQWNLERSDLSSAVTAYTLCGSLSRVLKATNVRVKLAYFSKCLTSRLSRSISLPAPIAAGLLHRQKLFFCANLNEVITKCLDTYCNIKKMYVSTTVFITQGNYVGYIFRLLNSHIQAYSLQVKSQDATHTLGSQCVYIRGILKKFKEFH